VSLRARGTLTFSRVTSTLSRVRSRVT
jgi:hypothetical protein